MAKSPRKSIPKPSACLGCGEAITADTKTGRCRKCKNVYLATQPDFIEKRANSIRAKWANDPAYVAKMLRTFSKIGKANGTDPVRRARLVEMGYAKVGLIHSPEARAKVRAKSAEIGRKLTERALAWCPLEYRDEYNRLTRGKNLLAADARQIVLKQIAHDKAKVETELSPFERQNRALERGATLYEAAPRATLDRPGVYRS